MDTTMATQENVALARSLFDLGKNRHSDPAWLLYHHEGVSSMFRLPSRTLAAGTMRTAGQTPQPIRRGWLTAGATVFGQSVFQLLDPRSRLGQLLFQREQFSYQRFEEAIFFSQGLQFFFVRHGCTLVAFLSFGKSVGDLSSYAKAKPVAHGCQLHEKRLEMSKPMYSTVAISIALSLIVLIALTTPLSTDSFGKRVTPARITGIISTHTKRSSMAFVSRSGSSLLLNRQPFRFAGANMHWLALDNSTDYPSQLRVNDALDAAKEMGLTVIRSHDLGISTGCPNCIEPSPGVFNETALEYVDYVIKAAGDRGLRLIIPLTDNWHYSAGGKHNFTDWRGISDENLFYYKPQVIRDFETYIGVLLNRVNIYTGIPYKDDPTILAWETGNELQPPTSWTQTISAYIKSIDPKHLVIDGRAGIDPNAASLTNVDILSDHYYPKSILKMNTDARAAAKAGKAFIVGEFDWTGANGGDSLSKFLANVQANPDVTGDAFWELWSHNDQYGYTSGDQYTLHYPGDTAAMHSSVQLLRSYAYKMSDRPVPPDSLPGTPLLETVIRNGTTNTLIWQGTAVAASYTIERSTIGPNGPWAVICSQCATDNDTPWVDTQVPAGPLWYRVTAYNLSGIAGPPSASYQAGSTGMIIDNLNDWGKVYQHSRNLRFDTINVQYMRGDTSRVTRRTATHEFVTWRQANMISFQAIAYFWPYEPVSPFSFYTSGDGKNWTAVVPGVVSIYGDWQEYIYTLQNLTNVNYVKMVWNNITGQPWNPNLGAVSIL